MIKMFSLERKWSLALGRNIIVYTVNCNSETVEIVSADIMLLLHFEKLNFLVQFQNMYMLGTTSIFVREECRTCTKLIIVTLL